MSWCGGWTGWLKGVGKLTNLRPQIATLSASVAGLATMQRDERLDWRKWYSTARWKRLREAIKLRDRYACQMCGKVSVAGMVVDHRRPHRGDERMFFDETNLQLLCKAPCHDKHKQALEVAGRI
jgi:5-methylcytosine-specific restriction protein A